MNNPILRRHAQLIYQPVTFHAHRGRPAELLGQQHLQQVEAVAFELRSVGRMPAADLAPGQSHFGRSGLAEVPMNRDAAFSVRNSGMNATRKSENLWSGPLRSITRRRSKSL